MLHRPHSLLIALLAFLIFPGKLYAGNCTSPVGVPGALERMASGGYHVCIGSTSSWHPLELSATVQSCSPNNSIDYDATLKKHKVCEAGTFKALSCEATTVETAPTYASAGPSYSGIATSSTGSVALASGQSLLVCLAWAQDNKPIPSMTWNGQSLTRDLSVDEGAGGVAAKASAFIYSLKNVSVGATANLTVSHNDALPKAWTSVIVNGLASGAVDKIAGVFSAAVTSGSATLSTATTQNNEFIFACLGRNMKGVDTGTWGNSFTGASYVATVESGTPGSNVASHSGYRIVTTTSAFTTSKSFGATSADTAPGIAAYKSVSTTSCPSFGACTTAGSLDYSISQNAILWCDGTAWRKSKYLPALGAFSITGVSGGTDLTNDATMSDTTADPDIYFGTSAGATSYTVTLKFSDGTPTSCTAQTVASSPARFTSCPLGNNSYLVTVSATNSTGSSNASNSPFSIMSGTGGSAGTWTRGLMGTFNAPDENTCGHPSPEGQPCAPTGSICNVRVSNVESAYSCTSI